MSPDAMREALRVGFYAVLDRASAPPFGGAARSGEAGPFDRDDLDLARLLVGPGGARVLQIRIKPAATEDIVRIAQAARAICDHAGALLVINDRVDIALAVGADAVHLGQTDLPLADARRLGGARLAYGISTHDLDQVTRAVADDPAYIAYGPVFATTTKDNPDPVQGLAALRAAVERVHELAAGEPIPVVAIGGITPDHAGAVFAAGATAVCAISGVNRANDVASAARAMHNSYARLRGDA